VKKAIAARCVVRDVYWKAHSAGRARQMKKAIAARCVVRDVYWKAHVRFWITKNSELPVREQLVRQVLLGILSEDLPSGHKLPSVRAVARRHRIHSNTVSAAYHDLLEQGWLELRRGSGLYVRPLASSAGGQLDGLLTSLLEAARRQNYEPEEVLQRLEHRIHPVRYERIVIAEPDPAMREILEAELAESLSVPVSADWKASEGMGGALVVALPTRAAKIRRQLARGVPCIALRVRSARASIESQTKPAPDTVVTIVSRSAEIRLWSRAMLIAVGLEPDALSEVDTADAGWRDRLSRNALVVADVIAARELPPGCAARVFRIIADSSIAELKQFCGL
jgi:DNA-binding transcriptional regulator YhcF (GntR family)